MKTIKIAILGLFLLVANLTQAQVSVNINIGATPDWGPAGYKNIEYYYLPDIRSYYDVRASQFIYFGGGKWVRSKRLPNHYRNYDLYNGYKVVLNDYHGRTPYVHYDKHKVRYYKGYHREPQKCYKPRKENKHYAHTKHKNHHNKRDNHGRHKRD
ncbi:hypothetical protein [Flavobacterium piscis]|uniref:Uncharacterized protein n=1 Tax=Flavobacterium piscis TaxID=1114874 RepID=A0ABU1YCQ1_9FLAO|nr:hypothetical protein [Flavobacterium piscis]MDR7212012.1 hypothetical protein [Flavobacterium piscis]